PDCAYNHPLYPAGYRYNSRVMGHSIDGDGRSYSVGSTLVDSRGHTWSVSLRYMQINLVGSPDPNHSLSATPQDRADIQLSHVRSTSFGRVHIGIGYSHLDDEASGVDASDITGFIRWSMR
ncbi:MAG: capsule assembly Wzi family protein, partial [Gammaproteobacteria bacterium]